jgi:hypothetical protein
MTMNRPVALLFVPIVAAALSGCLIQEDKNADKFREAIPSASDVKLKEPTNGSPTTAPQSAPGLSPLDNTPGAYAKYYKFTRDIFDGVNLGTGYILGAVTLLVMTPPSTLSGGEAIWGPGSEALSPAEWRFRATEIADGEIEYFFEGHPKTSDRTDDWLPILHGKGYSKHHANHRQGWFELNYENANTLDPARLNADNDSGKTTVNYALTSYPITINCKLEPNRPGVLINIVTTAEKSGGGKVDIQGTEDLDASKATKLEDISMHSRWLATGAGRADVTLSGGDLPAGTVVQASECWSTSFARDFYTDNLSLEPTYGSESVCPYPTAEFD